MIFHRNRHVGGWALALVALGLFAAAARGQADGGAERQRRELQRNQRFDDLRQQEIDQRLRANQDVPAGQRALIDYGAYYTFSFLSVDDRQNTNHGLRQNEIAGYARVNLDGANEFFVRARTGYQDFNTGDSFEGRGDENIDPDIDRGYYRFDLQRYRAAYGAKPGPNNLVFQAGRDLTYWANGLTLGQVLDGVNLSLTSPRANLDIVAGVTPVRTVDIDTSRPSFDHNTRRGFYGALLTGNFGRQHPFIYALAQRDYNEHNFLARGQIRTKFRYDSYYLGFGSAGSLTDRLLYGVEAVYQSGYTLSNAYSITSSGLQSVPQTRDRIEAYAADARLDYLLTGPRNSRLSAEGLISTGDPDRGQSSNTFNGNRTGTRDHSFNGFGLLNTGLAFSPEASNLMALRVGASTYPLPDVNYLRRFQVGADFFVFGKYRRDGAFDETTFNNRYLGYEPDLYVNWQVTSDLTVSLRYGIFFPSSTLVSHDDPRQFFYGGITLGF